MKTVIYSVVLMLSLSFSSAFASQSAADILQTYVDAWRGQQEMAIKEPITLHLAISGEQGGEFTVVLPLEGAATLAKGKPDKFTLGFRTDIEFLRRLHHGELNALTAMGQAHANDPTPLQFIVPEGFRWTSEARNLILPLTFHFWNRDWPERIPFAESYAREVHGANAVVFFYESGVRTAWYQIKPGMHVNRDPKQQTNPFKSLLIIINGEMSAQLAGKEMVLKAGEAVMILPGMAHEFWSEGEQQGEAILVMFGPGS